MACDPFRQLIQQSGLTATNTGITIARQCTVSKNVVGCRLHVCLPHSFHGTDDQNIAKPGKQTTRAHAFSADSPILQNPENRREKGARHRNKKSESPSIHLLPESSRNRHAGTTSITPPSTSILSSSLRVTSTPDFKPSSAIATLNAAVSRFLVCGSTRDSQT